MPEIKDRLRFFLTTGHIQHGPFCPPMPSSPIRSPQHYKKLQGISVSKLGSTRWQRCILPLGAYSMGSSWHPYLPKIQHCIFWLQTLNGLPLLMRWRLETWNRQHRAVLFFFSASTTVALPKHCFVFIPPLRKGTAFSLRPQVANVQCHLYKKAQATGNEWE